MAIRRPRKIVLSTSHTLDHHSFPRDVDVWNGGALETTELGRVTLESAVDHHELIKWPRKSCLGD